MRILCKTPGIIHLLGNNFKKWFLYYIHFFDIIIYTLMYFSSSENVEDLESANNILLVQRPEKKDESEEVRSFSYIFF